MLPKVERLVNLTVALLEARRPLTFAEIKQRTRLYQQDDPESARRMFERDKDELRRLGVPIEVQDIAFGEEPGYRVVRRDYELPDVPLDSDEVAVLALALRLTGSDGSRLALAKLAARAPDPASVDAPPGVRVEVRADPVDAFADGVLRRIALRFTYRTANGAVGERIVDPYATVRRRGAWYLVARDHGRDALRAFRLDRVVDGPRTVGQPGAFERPDDLDVGALVAGPEAEPVTAVLAVSAALRWEVEARGGVARPGEPGSESWAVYELTDLDAVRDLPWLLALAGDVVVLEPAELRDAVRAGLARVAAAHGADR